MNGTVLGGRYELEQLVGTGGMADVYRARDSLLGRTIAVKILHPQYAKDPVFIQRFRQEAQAAANLNQQNIVDVYDWGIEGETYYLVMEYVEGRNLKNLITEGGPLLPERSIEIALAICAALEAAHVQGIIHRDIKPQNIVVTGKGQIKVMDFGIARSAGGTAMTQTGTIMGTAQYISPEQAQGQTADPRSDLYSLGIVLYEMLAGKVPFDGETPVSIAYKHVREDPLPPSMINPDVSPELEAVVMKALSKNPQNRYQSAVEMRADLERCLEGTPVYATPLLPATEASATQAMAADMSGRGRRSLLWLWILIIALLVAAIGLGVWLIFRGGGSVEVPQVVGQTTEKAEEILKQRGLKMNVSKSVIDLNSPEGVVLSQDPQEGRKVSAGGTVNVVVTKGAVTVPDLMGLTRAEAEAALENAGLEVGGVSDDFNPSVEKGRVARQSPEAGAQVSEGSTVTIIISKGPEMVVVPDVTGMTSEAAESRLDQAGLTATIEETPSSQSPGTVLEQNPESGQRVPRGSPVALKVAGEPDTAQVPGVIGMTQDEAEAALRDAGFQPYVIQMETTPANVGLILDQKPKNGAVAERESQVTIYLGVSES